MATPASTASHGNPPDPSVPRDIGVSRQATRISPSTESIASSAPSISTFKAARHGLVEDLPARCWTSRLCFEFITHDRAHHPAKAGRRHAHAGTRFPAATESSDHFIPPYDALVRQSRSRLEALVKRGFHICTQSWNTSSAAKAPAFAGSCSGSAAGEIGRGQLLFVCDDYAFTHPARCRDRIAVALDACGRMATNLN